MLIAIYADAHWCQYSSIVRKRGEKYSVRLENLIKSVNWAESMAFEKGCGAIINLGDFFDKSELNADEITALDEVFWSSTLDRFNLIGNHEMGRSDLSTSSCDLFNFIPRSVVVSGPCIFEVDGCELAFLPYCLEENRKPIDFPNNGKRRILFSHNDILGIQMGKFVSQSGYSIEDIEANCDICFNGHLHNGMKVSDKIINVGNLTGQNFSEDAYKYTHGMYIIDTDTLHYDYFVNPFALNFYKIDFSDGFREVDLSSNAVCAIKVKQKDLDTVKTYFNDKLKNIVEARITIIPESNNCELVENIESFSVDHLKQFNDYVLTNFENTDILLKELAEVCR